MPCRPLAACGALLLLFGPAALAQGFTRSPSEGMQNPVSASAVDDGPTALSGNPAGLAFQGSFELNYLRSHAFAERGGSADGLFAGTALGALALGASAEWLRADLACAPLGGCSSRARRLRFGRGLRPG